MSKQARLVCAASIVIVFGASGMAQQTVPFRNNTPIAPQGITIPPLPDKPVVYHTAEGQDIRVVVVAKGLSHPRSCRTAACWSPNEAASCESFETACSIPRRSTESPPSGRAD